MKHNVNAGSLAAAGTAIIAGIGIILVLAACTSTGRHHGWQAPRPTASASHAGPDTRTAEQKIEDTFIGATAAHLCNVGQTVYDDPKALAAAYQSPPPYPGLTRQQVADLTQRLRTDPTLSSRLTQQLHATCTHQ